MKQSTSVRKRASNRQPIKHTKTFSGCWTCRDRHVKCDEGRPECARCLKGGFECQGYGIRLVWVDPDTQEREQNIRRAIGAPAIYEDDSRFMQVDVPKALDAIERLSAQRVSLASGPFSVFALNLSAAANKTCLEDQRWNSLNDVAMVSSPSVLSGEGYSDDDEEDVLETVISPVLLEASTPAHTSELSNTLYPSRHSLDARHPSILRHLDLLPRPAEQRELIHHWTSFVSWHLVPVDRADNPFRSVFTPMALSGLTSPSKQSNGQIALFHALCATSAFSRGQLLNDNGPAFTLAMKHYNLAIMHLRHSLANVKDSRQLDVQRGAILATITMFSAMDMITGRSSEWRTHLQGGASWLGTIEGNVWDRDKSSSMVYQAYLSIAALCNINLPATVNVESDDFLDQRHYVLDRLFGLTRPILKSIVMMNALIKRFPNSDISADPETLDELELQLYEQTPDSLDLEGLDPLTKDLTRHHAYVFYYASLIYFQRTVRRRPPDELQELVRYGVGHLQEIEDLGGEAIGCTLAWPPFVVACECLSTDLQEQMLAWYVLKRRHGFMNLEISKDIAKELWRRRSLAPKDVDIQWQDVLKEMNMDIVLA
ncbi:hypothetical protein A1O1_07238 [Capronia coronata CBS 617.96]|uniref:Zn(2)-C6 fungal-type domain-containing protein n=1 Tax=Capronia coronata CBS 617.96 TaxID=1182541 RepID=W9Y1V0_9EURO|nr:uncharacterized protein A1O1_07238 [Capronia coronata CBS 617.96]EXJ83615.1 hypothetical protein A1O1_07238 [Capronia coronata CBS 617.96]